MKTPSIISAIQKLRFLLNREEKKKCLVITVFSLFTSLFEILTASVIVLFAKTLNQPEVGLKYLKMIGFSKTLSPNRVVFYIVTLVGLTYLVKNAIAAAEVYFQSFAIQRMNYNFKNNLLHLYAKSDYGFYLTRNSSLGIQTISNDSEQMFSNGMVPLANIISESVVFMCLVSMIVVMNPSVALVIFTIGALTAFFVTKWLLPKFYNFGIKIQKAGIFTTQNLVQFFHAFKEIILLGKRKEFIDAYQYYSRQKTEAQAMQIFVNAMPRMVIEVLFVGLFVITIWILCLKQENPIQMMGIIASYLYVGFRLMPGINRMINQMNTFKALIPSIERVYEEYTRILGKEQYQDLPDFKFKDFINLKDLSFRYLNTSRDVLTKITLQIKKGECIGIVGETGSGKSTLVDIILGLLMPTQGSIAIDDNYSVSSYQWHRMIGYVPQGTYLTDDTIEANIAFGEKEIDLAQIKKVIHAAQLEKFITQLPEGAKTKVGDRGVRLSGGERQRIAIARALYRDPEVLIFDEATSALDSETEERLMETIRAISKNHTVIMIAHRLSTLKDCNRIVVIEGGNIKEITSYENIEKRKAVNHAKN